MRNSDMSDAHILFVAKYVIDTKGIGRYSDYARKTRANNLYTVSNPTYYNLRKAYKERIDDIKNCTYTSALEIAKQYAGHGNMFALVLTAMRYYMEHGIEEAKDVPDPEQFKKDVERETIKSAIVETKKNEIKSKPIRPEDVKFQTLQELMSIDFDKIEEKKVYRLNIDITEAERIKIMELIERTGLTQKKIIIRSLNEYYSRNINPEHPIIIPPQKLIDETRSNEQNKATLNQLKTECYEIAKSKGWHDQKRELPELLCLIHSEVSEALESYRNNEPPYHVIDGKPEGVLSELADVVIRVLDAVEEHYPMSDFDGILRAKMEFNKTREYKHGGKAC